MPEYTECEVMLPIILGCELVQESQADKMLWEHIDNLIINQLKENNNA